MAFEGMLLGRGDPGRGGNIYAAINEQYWWPYTYNQIHRLLEFYNRTLTAWAKSNGHKVVPINEQMPWQPELYRDGIHEMPTGEALHAWVVLQSLMPKVRDDLAHQRLPRAGCSPDLALASYWKIHRMKVADALAQVPARATVKDR
jgi:hypothetical protein